jgi:hypothetical protein
VRRAGDQPERNRNAGPDAVLAPLRGGYGYANSSLSVSLLNWDSDGASGTNNEETQGHRHIGCAAVLPGATRHVRTSRRAKDVGLQGLVMTSHAPDATAHTPTGITSGIGTLVSLSALATRNETGDPVTQ